MILLIMMGISAVSFSQNTSLYRQPVIEKNIPKIVSTTFKVSYPDAYVFNWYITHISYWYDDYSGGWYNNWYGPRQVVVYTYTEPAYFEVEFSAEPGETSRAIYNRYGYWFETRTKLSGLPANIADSLKNSKYGAWNWSIHKERIEAPGMPGSIYRLKVSKGLRSVIIRINDQGILVQTKETDAIIDINSDAYEEKEKNKKTKK